MLIFLHWALSLLSSLLISRKSSSPRPLPEITTSTCRDHHSNVLPKGQNAWYICKNTCPTTLHSAARMQIESKRRRSRSWTSQKYISYQIWKSLRCLLRFLPDDQRTNHLLILCHHLCSSGRTGGSSISWLWLQKVHASIFYLGFKILYRILNTSWNVFINVQGL